VDGKQAEEILLNQTFVVGSFLVRDSRTSVGDLVLSVKVSEKKVTHVIINQKDGFYFFKADREQFKNVTQLIDHFRSHDVTLEDGSVFMLTQAINKSKVPACNIDRQITELGKKFEVQKKQRNGFWEEFQNLEQIETITVERSARLAGSMPENRPKNRYKNILPFDHSRVVLKSDVDSSQLGSDYINANYIRPEKEDASVGTKCYIATQGCLQQTVGDWWRMIWQENCRIIVMVTQLVEMGRSKCIQYWPEDQKTIRVEVYKAAYVISHCETVTRNDYKVNVLSLQKETAATGGKGAKSKNDKASVVEMESRRIYHFQFLTWPDKNVPQDPGPILSFVSDINEKYAEESSDHPVVVHCSAGIGRTGTLIAIDILQNQIKREGVTCEIDVSKVVQELRRQRSGMVQIECQYEFIYLAIKKLVEHMIHPETEPMPSRQVDSEMGQNNNDLQLYGNLSANSKNQSTTIYNN